MGKIEDTLEAYYGSEEKAIVEKDKMDLVQALLILRCLRDIYETCDDVREAFNTVFEWIDNAILFQKKLGKDVSGT